jgi:hypothetical protein
MHPKKSVKRRKVKKSAAKRPKVKKSAAKRPKVKKSVEKGQKATDAIAAQNKRKIRRIARGSLRKKNEPFDVLGSGRRLLGIGAELGSVGMRAYSAFTDLSNMNIVSGLTGLVEVGESAMNLGYQAKSSVGY